MTPDELAGQLSHIQGYLKGQGDQLKEIKDALLQLSQMDRTVAQHGMRLDTHEKEQRELSHDIKNCQHLHRTASDVQAERIKQLEAHANRAAGAITAFKVVLGAAGAVLMVCASWVYERAELNYGTNKDQGHALMDLRKDVERIDRVIGK